MSTPSTDDLQKLLLQLQIDRLTREDDERAAASKKSEADAAQQATSAAKKQADERRAATAADLSAGAASLATLTGSSVTFPDKTVFREHVAAAAALQRAASAVATTITKAAADPSATVLLTGRTDQLETVTAAAVFGEAVDELLMRAQRALPDRGIDTPSEAPGSVFGSVVAAAVSLFDLLSVETSIASSNRTATELETHVAVLHELLTPTEGATAQRIVHETIGLPSETSALREKFAMLREQIPALEEYIASLAAEIAALGKDPPAAELAELQDAKKAAEDAVLQISAFVTAALTPDDASNRSPLQGALVAERLTGTGPVRFVAVVSPARISADQIALKRRIFAPRVVVTASATIDVVVLDVTQRTIVAAASHTAEDSFQARFPMAWSADPRDLRPRYDYLGSVFGD